MSFSYLFDPNKQFQDRNGVNNVGGFLRVYIDGTDDRATTYKDFNGTLNEADIMLDSDGRAVVIVDDSLTFRIEVYERDGALQWTVTQFTARGEGDGGGSSTPVVVDGTANEIDVTERMTAGVKYYTIGLATVVKNTLLGLIASFSNLVGILNSKADKVQVATAGNLAALDASGNLTDSGSKAADFKTKQTPVADPSASGAGLEFIDSISQNANGEITPHKKAVQDGTTAQKGVVKLSNAIDSTSVTEAATPKAVKDAYDELNNKIVARAVFLSQAEWAVQSQLQGDPAKVYYVENGTGEDAYTVYVWRESTSTYEEVDESSIDLDGYWHDSPTTTGSGNVVTNITLGNDGVPQVEKGMSAEPAFSVLQIAKGGTGGTTKKAAAYNIFSDILHLDESIGDTSEWIQGIGSPSATLGPFCRNKILKLWTYIQKKISSVLGLTASSYGGKAANAGSADTASAAASGSALETAINAKQDTISDLATIRSGATAGASALQPSGNGSNLSVTPDGTSTGYDLGSSTTLKAFAQKFKNLVSALKALAFKDKVSDSDINGTISDSHIASASTWNGKQDSLGISASGETGKFLNERGAFVTPGYPSVDQNFTNTTSTNAISTKAVYQRYFDGKIGANTNVIRLCRIAAGNFSNYRQILKINICWAVNVYGDIRISADLIVRFINNIEPVSVIQEVFDLNGNEYRFGWVADTTNGYVDLFVTYGNSITSAAGRAIISISISDNNSGLDYSVSPAPQDTYPTYTNSVSLTKSFPRINSNTNIGSTTTPVYVDPDGQVQPCTASNILKTNTATLYIAGYTDDNIPYYHVKNIKNGCVNHVDFSGITNSTCDITFEAPTLSTGEEYDYIISLEGYTNNSGYSTGSYVENCKQVLRYDYVNNLWIGEPLFLQATDWRQICVVRGNTCEWKRIALS